MILGCSPGLKQAQVHHISKPVVNIKMYAVASLGGHTFPRKDLLEYFETSYEKHYVHQCRHESDGPPVLEQWVDKSTDAGNLWQGKRKWRIWHKEV